MTRGSKFITLLLVQTALLGGAAVAGGRYVQTKYLVGCEKERAALDSFGTKILARELLMEGEVGAHLNNYSFTFERMVQAQIQARKAGLHLEQDFAELQNLLITQSPEVKNKLWVLADKIHHIPLGIPEENKKPAPAAPPATGAPGAPAAPAPAGAPTPQAAQPPAAPAAQAAPAAPASGDLAAGHKALLDAKVALISSEDTKTTVQRLAQARVLLDEAGRTDFDAELDDVIDAVRHKDEARARTGLDTLLKKLRNP